MCSLQDTILNEIILPLLRLTSSLSLCFPSGSHSRKIVLYRIIDVIYLIGLRIGFEMTRKQMSFVLQRFFASFDRVHGPHSRESEDEGSKALTNDTSVNVCEEEKGELWSLCDQNFLLQNNHTTPKVSPAISNLSVY